MSDYDASSGSGATVLGLLRNVGGWSKPSGRGWFMFRCLTVGTSTAAMLGVTMAFTLGSLYGAGMLGFLIGSCMGFIGGSYHYYAAASAEALYFLRKHPRLMQHHLECNYPTNGFNELDIAALVRREREGGDRLENVFGSWAMRGQTTSAYHTAQGALLEVDERIEAALIESAVAEGVSAWKEG